MRNILHWVQILLPSAAKAAPSVDIAGRQCPPVIGLTNRAPRVVQRADDASGTGTATAVA
ncbi:hypothetical protein PF005_g15680 [Phytophthora fragariae]|uniref:Uncharacterized protein n=1 Tax=Phytophthora fragariae TaxID=53985 RepID=A0A6A3TDT2_9STRA|nr:hypothetical protein PF003_g28502 [Phytophthora fragariae]KAE8933137.1 hypothetical protein PF009_g16858 [Phytophthora fragariae]KAE8998985.1 hypothetical protein PF011_g14821 [Phytophthora fragariae]KAE9098886.1 hypothetical protein PF010_g15387 [Phytophthora fragariae]KAE9100049.1 hypothetical protein PF007_g15669 [Phytophthora fragariae]